MESKKVDINIKLSELLYLINMLENAVEIGGGFTEIAYKTIPLRNTLQEQYDKLSKL